MGINERDGNFQGRMYNAILYLGAGGEVLGVHRKICNTVNERFFHTPGDGGANLKTVFQTEIGNIGGSICGEHSQLLLLYNWMMLGIQVHCSLWPGSAGLENLSDLKTRAFCYTAGVYGVLAATYMPESARPKNFYSNSLFGIADGFRGGSGIVNPYGEYVAGPVYDEEKIVYGEIDLGEIDRSRYAVNLTGIYSRWDILSLNRRQEVYTPFTPMFETAAAPEETGLITALEARITELEQQVSQLKTELAGREKS
jgi:predicted amidohydrolase